MNDADLRRTLERFGRLRRSWNLLVIQQLKPLGVAPQQSLFLRTLRQLGPCSLASIASHSFTDPAANVRLADVLVKRGWIVRREDPRDRRRWTVHLSRAGGRRVVQIDRIIARNVRKALSPLNLRELRQFDRLLTKLLLPRLRETERGREDQRKLP